MDWTWDWILDLSLCTCACAFVAKVHVKQALAKNYWLVALPQEERTAVSAQSNWRVSAKPGSGLHYTKMKTAPSSKLNH